MGLSFMVLVGITVTCLTYNVAPEKNDHNKVKTVNTTIIADVSLGIMNVLSQAGLYL